jgi:hypothetical protein
MVESSAPINRQLNSAMRRPSLAPPAPGAFLLMEIAQLHHHHSAERGQCKGEADRCAYHKQIMACHEELSFGYNWPPPRNKRSDKTAVGSG